MGPPHKLLFDQMDIKLCTTAKLLLVQMDINLCPPEKFLLDQISINLCPPDKLLLDQMDIIYDLLISSYLINGHKEHVK